jgi:hypothetical protein
MEQEADAIKANAIKMSWFMRGGASYDDIMNMSFKERMVVSDLIKSNLETTKSSRMPFF